MNVVEFLGSKITKTIASVLIVGQVGLLFCNISYAAPASQFKKLGTMSSAEAKISGNAKGFEWLKNAQMNATTTNINSASGDISFNAVGLDNAPQNEQQIGDRNLNINQSNQSVTSRLNNIKMEKTNGDGSKNSVGLNLNDLTPDSASCKSNPDTCKKYYSNGQLPTTQQMQGLYNSDENTVTNLSQDYHDSLKEESSGSASSVQAQVYGILNDAAHYNKPDLANDPSLKNVNSVLSNSVSNPFSDCASTNRLLTSIKRTTHTKQIEKCVDNELNSCTIIHQPDLSVVTYADTVAKYGVCKDNKPGCMIMYLGDMNKAQDKNAINSMNSGNCAQGSISQSLITANADAITSVKIISVSGAGAAYLKLQPITSGSPETALFNINSNGQDHLYETSTLLCEQNRGGFTSKTFRGKDNKNNGPIDITKFFKTRGSNFIVSFNIAYAGAAPVIELEIEYDPKKAARNDMWTGDKDCINKATNVYNGKVQGSIRCTNQLEDKGGYIYGNGVRVPLQSLTSSYGLAGNCTQAAVSIVEELKNEKMPEGVSTTLCSTLKERGCQYSGQVCRKSYTDNAGLDRCAVYEYNYDCGYDTEINTPASAELTSCPGNIQCQGYDCVNLTTKNQDDENKKDFNKALGILNESQQAANDMNCSKDSNGQYHCTFFGGEMRSCARKKFLGVSNDCCNPEGMDPVNVQEQIEGILNATKVHLVKDMALTKDILDNTLSGIKEDYYGDWLPNHDLGVDRGDGGSVGSFITGQAWSYFKSFTGVGQQYSKIMDKINSPFVNSLNNIIPYAGDVFAAATNVAVDTIIQDVLSHYVQVALKFIMQKVGEAVATMMGESAAAGITGSMGAQSFADFVGRQFLDEATKESLNQLAQHVPQEVAQQAVSEAAANTVAGQIAAGIATCFCVITWIYAVYTIGKMVATIATKCKDDEYETASKIQQKLCDIVGHYEKGGKFLSKKEIVTTLCCYESQLSRILNKQIKIASKGRHILYPMDSIPDNRFIGMLVAYGSNQYPNCSGITEDQLASVDWTNVDLTEWLTLLKASGKISADDILANKYDDQNFDTLRNNYLPTGKYDSNGNVNNSQVHKY